MANNKSPLFTLAKSAGRGMPSWAPKAGPSAPFWVPWSPQPNFQTNVGSRGGATQDWSPAPPKEKEPTWKPWMPYFEMLGINPLEGKGMTATTPALRQRMQPDAQTALQDYLASVGISWEDYVGWSGQFMPRTPFMSDRRWSPAMTRRRF